MSDPRTALAASLRELPAEAAKREERHQLLATLLAAFADGELPAETTSQIDAHLLGCPRCRREVVVHRTLRLRLEQEPLAPAPASLRDRITSTIAAMPAPQWEAVAGAATPAPQSPRAGSTVRRFGRTGVLAGVVVIVALAMLGGRWLVERIGTPRASVVSAQSVPLFTAVLADYRRVTSGDLPGRARDLAVVRGAVSFPVQALEAPSLRLLAAWTTNLNGEPAAVLAYRWNDQVVLQYLVSELQLYRPAELRRAFANGQLLTAHDGSQNMVAWAESTSGSLVVGDIPLDRIEALRLAATPR